MKLLIATTNPAKQEEIKEALQSLKDRKIEFFSLADLNIEQEPKETGDTFEENAKIKAKFYAEKAGMPAIADDGGLEIDILGGQPGVKSRRWPGYEAGDKELIKYALKKLQGVPLRKRAAKLVTCVCLYHPQTKKFFCQKESIDGFIAQKPSRKPTRGYPFRTIFIVKKFNKYYDDLTKEQHQKINHRLKAVKKLLAKIES